MTCKRNLVGMTNLFFVSLTLLKRDVNSSSKDFAKSLQASSESKSLVSALKNALTIESAVEPNLLCHSQTRWFTYNTPLVVSQTCCWTRTITYKKEYRPPNLDAVQDSGTINKIPNLLHLLYCIIISNGLLQLQTIKTIVNSRKFKVQVMMSLEECKS